MPYRSGENLAQKLPEACDVADNGAGGSEDVLNGVGSGCLQLSEKENLDFCHKFHVVLWKYGNNVSKNIHDAVGDLAALLLEAFIERQSIGCLVPRNSCG